MNTVELLTQATQKITLETIAQEAGISTQSLMQYRLGADAPGRRNPSPQAQEAIQSAIVKLAKAQARHFTKLAQQASKGL